MKQCRPLAQALVEAKAEIDNETCKDTEKREEKKHVWVVWVFTWVKTNAQRCQGQRAQRVATRCERCVEKNW